MKKKIISILLGVLAFGAVFQMQAAEPAAAEQTAEAAVIAKVKQGDWLENYAEALAAAKQLKRPVLIDFTGSDWCGWCIRLDREVFSQKAFIKYAKRDLVLLKLDFPQRKKLSEALQKQNRELAKKFGIRGFPTIVIVDAEGKEIARTGYQRGGAKNYVDHLKDLLKKK
ncbi:MAG: thioredoxin family protein [Lentisphaeria bacterium]|nr:thioredoxin family protein [Lentisphaeria bacterium]